MATPPPPYNSRHQQEVREIFSRCLAISEDGCQWIFNILLADFLKTHPPPNQCIRIGGKSAMFRV